jgi:hypothetical protein
MENQQPDDLEVFSVADDQVGNLTKREKQLRKEISTIRKQREILKSLQPMAETGDRPEWISKLPKSFWYPTYCTNKFISTLNANAQLGNVPPDLEDWYKTSNVKEFAFNVTIFISFLYITSQILALFT